MNSTLSKVTQQLSSTIYNPQRIRPISLSCCHWRRKPKPERDQSKRNLQGEELKERLKRREEDIKRQEPYKTALSEVINRFKEEVDEIERQKHDMQGDLMKRELAEREQAVKNLAIITKSNEELKKQRAIQALIDEDEKNRQEEEDQMMKLKQREEIREKNRQIVLRVIEESRSFITADNLDEKINEALDKEKNYNYAITPEGEKIHSTKPPGNLDGWSSPSPSAYLSGGFRPGTPEWNSIFKGKTLTDGKVERRKENTEDF